MLFRKGRRPAMLAGIIALAVVAGCMSSVATTQPVPTPSTSVSSSHAQSPTPTVTPTPSPTWDADQAAAITAIDAFAEANYKVGADPSAFTKKQMTELMEPFGGGAALTSSVNWYLLLKKNGYRLVGEMVILSTLATDPVDDGRGTEVHVTRCQDQRQGKVVDKHGNAVTGEEFQLPLYNLRQYSVRKPPGEDAFRVFGYQTINGKCP